MVRLVRGLAALIALVALVVGVPVLLVALVGNPLPDGGLGTVGIMSDAAVLGLLAALGWLFWAQLIACVLWELPAAVRGVPAARFPAATGTQQRLVRVLVHSVVALGATSAVLAPGVTHHADATPVSAPASPGAQLSTDHPLYPDRAAGPAAVASAGDASAETATLIEVTTTTVSVAAGDTLWGLSDKHLGAGERWREIADLNRGRDMGDGVTFTSARTLQVGWVLHLPSVADPAPVPRPGPGEVVVEPGDSLWQIAHDHLGSGQLWHTLYEQNRDVIGSDPDLLYPGQVMKLPGAQPHFEGSQRAQVQPPTKLELVGPPPLPVDKTPVIGREPPEQTPVESPAESPLENGGEDRGDVPRPVAPPTGTPAQDLETSVADPGQSSETAEGTGEDDDITVMRALLATAVCLAGGALAMLTASRRRQIRERRAGRAIAATPAELTAVERAVLEAGAESMETTEFIDLGLRHLAASQRVAGRDLPNLGAAVIGADEFAVLFTDVVDEEPPTGWEATEDGRAWTLARNTILDPDLREQPAPFPALVSVGVDAEDRTWMLDLESTGVLGIAGVAAQREDLVRHLVAELALNTWSEGTEVLLTGDLAAETQGLNPVRVQQVDLETATRRGARMARDAASSVETMSMDLLEFRRDAVAIDSTGPLIIIVTGSIDLVDPELTETLRYRTRSRVVVVGDDEKPTIELTGDGAAYLHDWDVTLTPLILPATQATAMFQLLQATRNLVDEPMPDAGDDSPIGQLMRADGSLREETTAPRDATGNDPGSVLPEADDVYLEAGATTAEDLAALAPSVPSEIRAQIDALDPGLDADLAAWDDPDSRRPRVQVLGPVDVVAWGMRKDEVANLGGTIEFIVYLACAEHGISPERAAVALGWSEATVHNRARDARRMLGEGPDGEPWLPEATKSATAQQRGVATYELHPEVLVGHDLFRRLYARGSARGAEGIEDLVTALSLVLGRPFDRLRKRGYGWLAETPFDHWLTAGITDVAHLVVTHALAAGDTHRARWACEIAIKAVPDADSPRLDLAAVTAAEGSGSADEVVAEQVCDRVDADLTARSEQVIEQRGWLAS